MTKEQWIDFIRDYLSGGDCPADLRGRYHERDIEDMFSLVYSQLIYQVHANAVRYKDFAQFNPYIKAISNVPVLYDTDRDEYYSEVPSSVIQLPENRGIKQISPMQDQSTCFHYLNTPQGFGLLESERLAKKRWFYVEGSRIYYRNYNPTFSKSGLLFKIISDLSGFAYTDEMGLPAQQAMEIFNMVTTLLQARPLQKQTNDNTDIQIGGGKK